MSHLGFWAQVALWCVLSPLWWAPLLGMWISARLRRRERRAEWKADREAWLAERPYRELRQLTEERGHMTRISRALGEPNPRTSRFAPKILEVDAQIAKIREEMGLVP